MALTMLFLVIAFVLFLLLDWIRDNAESRQSLRKLQHDNATLMAQLDRSAARRSSCGERSSGCRTGLTARSFS